MNNNPHFFEVSVIPRYLLDASEPANDQYVFSYTITIRNQGTVGAQLLSRHWIITDANGIVEEVRGEGVIGQQPRIMPGKFYEYTSYAVIKTPVGSMYGSYQMIGDDKVLFDAKIPVFSLAIPQILN